MSNSLKRWAVAIAPALAFLCAPAFAHSQGVEGATQAAPTQSPAALSKAAQIAKIAPAVKVDDSKVGHFGYGTTPTKAQIAGWAIDVLPDGQGLPPGSGTVSHGADVFSANCAACHGTFGEGEDRYPKLAGTSRLTVNQPSKTVGNYWPYATTLWDYINRAMPFPVPHSLKPNDVYAITAYILNLNNIVPESFVANSRTLPKVKMPNWNGFILVDPRPDTSNPECMSNCVKPADVKISSTAEGKQLTPKTTGPLDTMQPK